MLGEAAQGRVATKPKFCLATHACGVALTASQVPSALWVLTIKLEEPAQIGQHRGSWEISETEDDLFKCCSLVVV
ncbi:hypothetical protein QQP08_025090 [Theobroma cacao]|nr:hypothetical protein QQP08_025090 [Theobroma cacao]